MDVEHVIVPAHRLQVEPGDLGRLPPAVRNVYRAVIDLGPVTLPGLEEGTGIPRRTIAYAISRLKHERLVAWHARLGDFRYRYFFVHPRLVRGDPPVPAGAVIRLDGAGRRASDAAGWEG